MARKYFTENVSKKSFLSYEEIINVYQSLDDEELALFPTKRRKIEHLVCRRCVTRRGFPNITGYISCPFSEYKTVFIDLNTSGEFKIL
jgi:hypothetical protein